MWTLYPFYHPHRSRFFNMATLYRQTLQGIADGLIKSFPSIALAISQNIEEIADKSYVKWEANGGVDLQLPSFKLTNRQMLWVCIAHKNSLKYQKNLKKEIDEEYRISNDFLHVLLKLKPGFREAFQCGNKTRIESDQIVELDKRVSSYYQRIISEAKNQNHFDINLIYDQ